jgi:hypothetical protein
VFTPAERDALREQLLERAQADERIVAAAITGSAAVGAADEWSDVDLFFGVADDAERQDVIGEWTKPVCGSGSTRGSHGVRTSCRSASPTRSCSRRSPRS